MGGRHELRSHLALARCPAEQAGTRRAAAPAEQCLNSIWKINVHQNAFREKEFSSAGLASRALLLASSGILLWPDSASSVVQARNMLALVCRRRCCCRYVVTEK